MKLHPHAAGLFFLDDPDWRRKLWRGGLTVVTPFVGWHIVLGYRRHLITHLCDGPDVMPEWRGNTRRHLVDGLKASCVIFGYLAPLYVVAFALASSRGFDASDLSIWIPAAFFAFPFLLPVSLPFAVLVMTFEGWIRPTETLLFAAAFASVVFVVPAAFLQVSRTGRFRSAFDLVALVTFFRRRFAAYSRAWIECAPIAIASHLVVPIAPWSIVWAYCGVMFLFNEVLVAGRDHGEVLVPSGDHGEVLIASGDHGEVLVASGDHVNNGWIQRTRHDARWAPVNRLGLRTLRDARGEDVRVIDLGTFSAPLPWRRARRPMDA